MLDTCKGCESKQWCRGKGVCFTAQYGAGFLRPASTESPLLASESDRENDFGNPPVRISETPTGLPWIKKKNEKSS